MAESYSSKVVFRSTPEQVSKLMRLDETASEPWRPEDLRAMVRHQLSAPVEFDVRSLRLSQPEQGILNSSLREAPRSGIRTFVDLFYSPHPPVELLRLSQKFFKEQLTRHPTVSPEHKIAYLFYLLSIVVARNRTGVKISKLTDQQLHQSVKAMADKPWVDEQVRKLLTEACQRTTSESDSLK